MLLYHLSTSPEEVSKDSEVFLHQDPSSTVDCEPVEFPVDECPPSVAPSSSLAPSNGASVPSTSPSLPPQGTQNVILIIAVSAGGSVLILVLGGILIVVVALVCKKKKSLGKTLATVHRWSIQPYIIIVKQEMLE